jgi:hypothetical protein
MLSELLKLDLMHTNLNKSMAMGTPVRESFELHSRERLHYHFKNTWNQPLGRIGGFLQPIELDPQCYVQVNGARLLTDAPVGLDRRNQIVAETHHLQELSSRRCLHLRLRALLPAREHIGGAVCSLVDGRRWHNYFFHWFLDCLPRLIAAADYEQRTGERMLLILPTSLSTWQKASLNLLGIDPGSHMAHRPVGGGGVAVERLIGYVAHRWQRLGNAPFDTVSPWVIRELGSQLVRGLPIGSTAYPRRLYLSRRGVQSRQVTNEAEVLALLEPHGFVAIQCEKISLEEQIVLFRDATHIVAPHGGSLTNLIHTEKASVLELFQEAHGVRPDFFQLAMIRGLDYQYAQCPCDSSGHSRVDTKLIQDFLELTL